MKKFKNLKYRFFLIYLIFRFIPWEGINLIQYIIVYLYLKKLWICLLWKKIVYCVKYVYSIQYAYTMHTIFLSIISWGHHTLIESNFCLALAVSKKYQSQIEKLINSKRFALSKKTSWPDQFRGAVNTNNGDVENAALTDHILHSIAFFWKVGFFIER